MSEVVLDASAVLAWINQEPGGGQVASLLPGSRISSVNYAEVITRMLEQGAVLTELRRQLAEVALQVVPFDTEQAFGAGRLRLQTRSRGLSLADRACLGLASQLGVTAVTADRTWRGLDVGVDIQLIRG